MEQFKQGSSPWKRETEIMARPARDGDIPTK